MKTVPVPKSAFGLFVFGLVFLLYARTVTFDFINYDDPVYVTENAALSGGITAAGLSWALTETGETNLWQPVTFISHMVDIELFGLASAAGHHLGNVFWHALAAVGFFLVLRQLFGSVPLALVGALVWAFHPQRVQSVAWVSERKDVLSGAFLLWSWFLWEKGREQTSRWGWLAGSFVLFILAGLSKPSVVPFPVVLLLGEWLRRPQEGKLHRELWRGFLPLLPFFAVSLAVACLTLWFQQRGGLGSLAETSPLSQRLFRLPGVFWWYLQTFVWPFPQKLWVYPQEVRLEKLVVPVVGVTASLLIFWFVRKEKLALFGAGVFFLFWLPVSGLVPVSFYNVAERYAYLPHLGLVILGVALSLILAKQVSETPRWWRVVGAGGLLVLMALTTWLQTSYWKDSSTLFSRERNINPRSLLAPIQLGIESEKRGDLAAALTLYQEALKIDPESGLAATNAGRILLKLGQPREAELAFREAIEKRVLNSEQPFLLLSKLLVEAGQPSQAGEVLEQGMVRFPRKVSLPMERGALALSVQRAPQDSLRWFERALQVHPFFPDALQGKGVALIEIGEVEKGRAVLRELLQREPGREAIRDYLGRARAD